MRNIVVTGGGTGIGRAVAEAFAGQGDQVVITGRRADVLAATAAAIGPAVRAVPFDASDPAQVEAALADLPDRVDVLVEAAAGQGARSSPAAVPGADAVLLSAVGDTTLVATVGARTYALTLLPGLLDEPGTAAALARLAGDVVAADTPGPAGDTTTSPRTTGSTGTSTG